MTGGAKHSQMTFYRKYFRGPRDARRKNYDPAPIGGGVESWTPSHFSVAPSHGNN